METKKLGFRYWPWSRKLNKDDIVIICGDSAFNWDDTKETNYWTDWLEDRPFTTISVMGNHENYDAIRALPVEEWNGGIVRKVRPHVMYLENGEIFNIQNHTIFVQGGAASVDKAYRKEGISWWPQEIPSYEEFKHAAETLERANFNVDIILSHTAPNNKIERIDKFYPQFDSVTNYLQKFVYEQVKYKQWCCGHFHVDISILEDNFHFLYNDIMELLPDNTIKYMGTLK